jgi:Ca2+-binding RTX toxin-like protein
MARIRGSDHNDVISGTSGEDLLYGLDGNDTFYASNGNDYINGGADRDTVYYGHSRSVHVDLRSGIVDKDHGLYRDTLVDIEDVYGSPGDDTLIGNGNNNKLSGEGGRDQLYGMDGNDTLVADLDDIVVDGGEGADTLVMREAPEGLAITLSDNGNGSAASSAETVLLRGIENVWIDSMVASVDDFYYIPPTTGVSIYGNSQDNRLTGSGLGDTLNGGRGNDTLRGSGGPDHFVFDHLGAANQDQHDVVVDFTHGEDVIELHSGVQNFQDLRDGGDRFWADYDSDNDGTLDSVLIHTSDMADTSILLQNVHTANLSASDFLFFH